MGGSVLQIFVLRDGALVASEMFPEGCYLIGSDPGCDLVLDDTSVALQHAQLQFGGGQVLLVDDASAGVLCNGEPVQIAVIRSSDDLQIGPYNLKIRVLGKRKPAAPAPIANGARLSAVPALSRPQIQTKPIPEPVRLAPSPDAELDAFDVLFDNARVEVPVNLPDEVDEVEVESEVEVEEAAEVEVVEVEEVAPARSPPPPPPPPPAPPPMQTAPAPRKRIPPRAVVPGAGLQPTTVLHARVLWGEALVAARSFGTADWVDLGGDEEAAVPVYGFPAVPQLAVFEGSSWRISPPQGVNVLERFAGGPWRVVAADQRGQVRLTGGRSLRLSDGSVHVELAAEWPQPKLGAALGKLVDWRGLALVLALGIALSAFLASLPPVPKIIPLPVPPLRRLVRAQPPPEKPKKQKKEKLEQATTKKVEVTKPSAVQSARNYRQAAAPLRALEKVTKATADVSRLLAGLKLASYKPLGGSPDAIPLLPSGVTPKPLPGLGGGAGMGGRPVTGGRDLLRSGNGGSAGDLGNGTAGKGMVRGVPITLPSRPPKIQGQIDRDAVAKVINDHVNEIRGCYERALLTNPNLGAGKVALVWTIGGDGAVTEVGTNASTLRSPEVVGCLLDLLRGLRFPLPHGGVVVVTYPILFNAVGY